MLTQITHTGVWVHDIDEALDFYTGKLGFEVRYDIREETWSWVTVAPPGSEAPELILMVPGPPYMDDSAAKQVLQLVASGSFVAAGILATEDCRADYEALSARGVEFQQEPMDRDYGVDAAFRDPSGNSWRMTQRTQ